MSSIHHQCLWFSLKTFAKTHQHQCIGEVGEICLFFFLRSFWGPMHTLCTPFHPFWFCKTHFLLGLFSFSTADNYYHHYLDIPNNKKRTKILYSPVRFSKIMLRLSNPWIISWKRNKLCWLINNWIYQGILSNSICWKYLSIMLIDMENKDSQNHRIFYLTLFVLLFFAFALSFYWRQQQQHEHKFIIPKLMSKVASIIWGWLITQSTKFPLLRFTPPYELSPYPKPIFSDSNISSRFRWVWWYESEYMLDLYWADFLCFLSKLLRPWVLSFYWLVLVSKLWFLSYRKAEAN